MTNEPRPRRLPLYLLDEGGGIVRVDGPALTLEAHGQAPIRYPVSRLARIVVSARHHWRPEASDLCLQHRIPVLFLDREGRHAGSLVPSRLRPVGTHEALARLTFSETGQERLENWLRGEYLQLIDRLGDRLTSTAREELVRLYVQQRQPGIPETSAAVRRAGQVLRALVQQRLLERHLSSHYPLAGGGWWALADELTDMLLRGWQLDSGGLERNLRAEASCQLTLSHRHIIEAQDRHLHAALRRLERIAREAEQEWP